MSVFDEINYFPTDAEKLFEAIAKDNYELVYQMTLEGWNVDLLDDDGWTVLQNAESASMLRALIENGADPEFLDCKGRTVWETSSEWKQAIIREALVNFTANALDAATDQAANTRCVRL